MSPKRLILVSNHKNNREGIFVNETNDMVKLLKNQVHDYINELLNNLPISLSESASKYKAIEREREIKDAKLLLLVIFTYAVTGVSQRMLAVFAMLIGAANISDQAWQKKFALRSLAQLHLKRHVVKRSYSG